MRDLGDGGHRGVGAPSRGALLEGDRRGNARHGVDVRPRQHGQKLAGVRRERLHEPPLALGEDDVEGERRFARPAGPRHDADLPVRDRAHDVLQVVLARVRHVDGVRRGRQLGEVGRPDRTLLRGTSVEPLAQRAARARVRLRDLVRGALGREAPAVGTAPGAEIDDPVARPHDVEVVLDHDDAPALLDQRVEGVDHVRRVFGVQARARLVDDEEGALGLRAEGARQLEALRLPAGERRQGLPDRQIPEPDADHRLQRTPEHVVRFRLGVERGQDVFDPHGEDVRDRPPLVRDREDLGLEAPALAHRAEQLHVGEKLHLHGLVPLARALLAPTRRHVEREVRGRQARPQRGGLRGEAGADPVPGLHVGGRVAARGSPEG